MNARLFALQLAIACAIGFAPPVSAAGVPDGSAVVGLWQLDVSLAPCGNPSAVREFLALQTFHLGGTVTGTDNHPSSGQGSTQGVWSYDRRTHRYAARQLFPRFVDNAYDGLQDIRIANIALSSRDTSMTGDVDAFMFNADGSVRVELCGAVVGERVSVAG